MQTTFTKKFMQDNRGCYSQAQLNDCSFMQQEPITLESILKSEIPLKDKYWFVCRKLATKEHNQEITIAVAEIVLPIYEKRYSNDSRPREAIDAAKQYIAGHISIEKLMEKMRAAACAAAADAYAYAYAAYAAAAAADAAAAAAAAAAIYAAATAIYAAAAAAAAAIYAAAAAIYAAAADAAIKEQLETYLYSFCMPFMENNK